MMADELEIVFPAYKKGGVARLVVVHRASVGRGMYHLKKRAFDAIRSLARRRLDFSHFSGECWSRVSLPPPTRVAATLALLMATASHPRSSGLSPSGATTIKRGSALSPSCSTPERMEKRRPRVHISPHVRCRISGGLARQGHHL